MSTQADRLTAITSQLVGDISRLPGVTLDKATEGQLVQLLVDSFEQVGGIAITYMEHGPPVCKPIRHFESPSFGC